MRDPLTTEPYRHYGATRLLTEAQCTAEWREFGKMHGEDALHYASTKAFNAYKEPDVLTRQLYALQTLGGSARRSRDLAFGRSPLLALGNLSIGTCRRGTAEGFWHTQKIGPFRSTGGNSWWFAGWSNLANTYYTSQLFGISAHIVGAMDTWGKLITFPPILMHHTSCSVSKTPWKNTLEYANGALLVDVSGDAGCAAGEFHDEQIPATECYGHDYGRHIITVTGRADCYFGFVDVRPPASPALPWWHHMAVRVHNLGSASNPKRPFGMHLLSSHTVNNLGVQHADSQSKNLFLLFLVPTNKPTFYYHTSEMPFAGKWIREVTKFHTHTIIFQEGLALTGTTAQQLGLHTPCTRSEAIAAEQQGPFLAGCDAVPTWSLGFAANDKLKANVLTQLSRVQRESQLHPSHRQYPRILCRMIGTQANVHGHLYARRSRQLCEEWEFKAGDKLLTIGFFGPPPHMPPGGLSQEGQVVSQHLHWYMFYEVKDHWQHASVALRTKQDRCDALTARILVIYSGRLTDTAGYITQLQVTRASGDMQIRDDHRHACLGF
eukprot:CAMPEP_0119313200 /NCGR_PEP_ID=MMETSP1333-20130426/28220_1 /TAXON_ID=418940 /ORGANISM="Scyphosphaera apsteinii, Strain RCC1455" /LENGTH=548 /DNA_ID=CAMNT_0007317981 /DNA_START=186 /DNA_END=1833 /DNA_ORIENTATION=+